MDLRFEAAAANEYAENTKNDVGFKVPKIYWNFTSENVMTLDWIEGISIREKEKLEENSIDTKKKISFERFIYALGIRHIGLENAKLIAKYLKSSKNFF